MRIATYNVEWFTNLFDDDGRLLEDNEWSARHNVRRHEQLAALGIVFTAMDADAIMVIEAPDGHHKRDPYAALEGFAARYGLRARKACLGHINQTQQEIALLYDPDAMTVRHDPIGDEAGSLSAPRFDTQYKIDLDIDARPETVRWSKPPLELEVEPAGGGRLRMIGVHAKSKAPHGARGPKAVMRAAIENRRKQLAQCIWLRERVVEHLDAGDPLIVLGDFNDGPGLDEYEELFGHSGVEVVMGEPGPHRMEDPHGAQLKQHGIGPMPSSARFWLDDDKRWLETLLDYIMISPDLMARRPIWRIWHPFDEPGCYNVPELREALLAASDHFPVTLDIEL